MKKENYWLLFWATGLPEVWLEFRLHTTGG